MIDGLYVKFIVLSLLNFFLLTFSILYVSHPYSFNVTDIIIVYFFLEFYLIMVSTLSCKVLLFSHLSMYCVMYCYNFPTRGLLSRNYIYLYYNYLNFPLYLFKC